MNEEKKSFYQKSWFIILSLWIFPPLGIFLMWKYKKFGDVVRVIFSVISIPVSFFSWIVGLGITLAIIQIAFFGVDSEHSEPKEEINKPTEVSKSDTTHEKNGKVSEKPNSETKEKSPENKKEVTQKQLDPNEQKLKEDVKGYYKEALALESELNEKFSYFSERDFNDTDVVIEWNRFKKDFSSKGHAFSDKMNSEHTHREIDGTGLDSFVGDLIGLAIYGMKDPEYEQWVRGEIAIDKEAIEAYLNEK